MKHTNDMADSKGVSAPTTAFTLIADFAGGTYISQHRAKTPARALAVWAKRFDFSILPRVSDAALEDFRASIRGDTPTPVDGTKGVWCASGLLGRRLLMLNIVRTATLAPTLRRGQTT